MALSRRDLLRLGAVGARASPPADARHRLPGVCRARRGRREVSAGVSARRLRRGQRDHPDRQQRVLRAAADHRHSETESERSAIGDFACRAERRRGVGHASGTEVDGAALEERSARVRTVRGQRGPHAEPLRNAGQRRGRTADRETGDAARRGATRLRIGIPEPAGVGARRNGGAGLVHGRSARGDERRHLGAERLAEGHRQARRSTIARSAFSPACTPARASNR